jgi:hypothetical protein
LKQDVDVYEIHNVDNGKIQGRLLYSVWYIPLVLSEPGGILVETEPSGPEAGYPEIKGRDKTRNVMTKGKTQQLLS